MGLDAFEINAALARTVQEQQQRPGLPFVVILGQVPQVVHLDVDLRFEFCCFLDTRLLTGNRRLAVDGDCGKDQSSKKIRFHRRSSSSLWIG